MSDQAFTMLNVYDVEIEGAIRQLICFLDPIRAGQNGIDSRSIVGEFAEADDGSFDPLAFEPNPEFLEAFAQYMNEEAAHTPDFIRDAAAQPGDWLYVVDPRFEEDEEADPPVEELLGCFSVDDEGRIVPMSFVYNREHRLFDPDSGMSGLLSDHDFYNWLNPVPGESTEE